MTDEILMIPLNIQCIAFLYSVTFGGILSLIFVFITVSKNMFSLNKFFVALSDIISFIIPVLSVSFISMKFCNGILRWYLFAGELMGLLIAYFAVGDAAEKIFTVILSFVSSVLSLITEIIKLPLKIINLFILVIIVGIRNIHKNLKKVYSKCKLCLKYTMKSLYNLHVWIGMSKNNSGKEVGNVARRRKRRSGFLVKIITLSFVVCAAVSFIHSQSEVASKRRELAVLNESIVLQQTKNDEVKRILDGDNDLEYIERIAREKLGYAYPDEKIFIDRSGG